jgi:predicted ABC-type ATPase
VVDPLQIPCIYVLAGTNGAGKSSIAGATFLQKGVEYFNPDEEAKRIRSENAATAVAEANSRAWEHGKALLKFAIAKRLNFAFETTLGGNTITSLLEEALAAGLEVRIWYAGLSSPELHIKRVRARVARGGHDIPEETIRARYTSSRLHLIRLLPKITELRLYDNSEDADPNTGHTPKPKLILHIIRGRIIYSCKQSLVPEWAQPILAAAQSFS